MEDWQEWQIRADQIATSLASDVDALEQTYLGEQAEEFNYRAFWPKFRDLKERVRTAPAIRLEPKLELERRLRTIGSRAYKAQEGAYTRSSERKQLLLDRIAGLRTIAERENLPRGLRNLRRDFDKMREEFDSGPSLVPGDRQAVWEAWREANQFSWQRLTSMWTETEVEMRAALQSTREHIVNENAASARHAIGTFFELLKSREAKQDAVQAMKTEVDELRREIDALDERIAVQRAPVQRTATQRSPVQRAPAAPAVDGWRSELSRNRDLAARLSDELSDIENQVQATDSILEQAMLRGTLVDKRRKLSELDRTSRALEQKIEQTEEPTLIPTG